MVCGVRAAAGCWVQVRDLILSTDIRCYHLQAAWGVRTEAPDCQEIEAKTKLVEHELLMEVDRRRRTRRTRRAHDDCRHQRERGFYVTLLICRGWGGGARTGLGAHLHRTRL
jgi:hypothetical protein